MKEQDKPHCDDIPHNKYSGKSWTYFCSFPPHLHPLPKMWFHRLRGHLNLLLEVDSGGCSWGMVGIWVWWHFPQQQHGNGSSQIHWKGHHNWTVEHLLCLEKVPEKLWRTSASGNVENTELDESMVWISFLCPYYHQHNIYHLHQVYLMEIKHTI